MSDETLAQRLTGRKDGTPEEAVEMVNALAEAASLAESQNQALQEALRVLLEDAVYMHKEHGARDDCRAISRARQILSPTQETDPE